MRRNGSRWIGVAGLVLFGGLAPLPAQTTWSSIPTADTFVTTGPGNDLTTQNFGGLGALEISGSAAARAGAGFRGIFDSVLRFDLAAAKTTFDSAYGVGGWAVQTITLRLATSASTSNPMFNTNSAGQFSIVWMEDDSWIEGSGASPADGITYASLPGFLGAEDVSLGTFAFNPATSGTDGALSVYTLSLATGLTNDVLSGGSASFELLAASNEVSYLVNSRSFGTVGRRPLLSVTAVAVPEPSIYALVGVFCLGLALIRWHRAAVRRSATGCH